MKYVVALLKLSTPYGSVLAPQLVQVFTVKEH